MKDVSSPVKKENIRDIHALTPMQEGMLFHYLKEPEAGYYTEQLSVDISGNINPGDFIGAWNRVVESNDMLRCAFRWEGMEKPVQIILKSHQPNIIFIGFDPESELGTGEQNRWDGTFDLTRPPFHIELKRLDQARFRMVIRYFHILLDGWSTGVVLREFFNAYEVVSEAVSGGDVEIPLKPPFKEYVKWCLSRDHEAARDFWERYLDGYEGDTALPLQPPAPGPVKEPGGIFRKQYSKELFEALEEFARSCKVTTATLIYMAWGMLLRQYNNSGDIVFGATVSGRGAAIKNIEQMVGLFINTLPLRFQTRGNDTLAGVLERLHGDIKAREPFETLPLTEIKQHFNTIVVIENYPLDAGLTGTGRALTVEGYHIDEKPHYDITLGITMFDGMQLELLYPRDKFHHEGITRLVSHFTTLLEQMPDNPGALISSLEIMSFKEKRRVLYEFNQTEESFPSGKTVPSLFEEQAARLPDRIAIVGFAENRSNRTNRTYMSYSELNRRAELTAASLREQGAVPGAIIAIKMERSIDLMIALLAAWKTGCAYVPIDPNATQERNDYILSDCNTGLLVGEGLSADRRNPTTDPRPTITPERFTDNPRTLHRQPAYIIYTSGTTGQPKGVVVGHDAYVNIAFTWRKEYSLEHGLESQQFNLLQMAGFTFDVFAGDVARVFCNGGVMVICPDEVKADPPRLYSYIMRFGIDLLESTPALILPLLDYVYKKGLSLPYLRLLIFGSDILRMEDYRRTLARFGGGMRIINSYGITEAAIDSSYYEEALENLPSGGNVPIGKPLSNTSFLVLDAWGNPQVTGAAGELFIAGAGLSQGYLNDPELTRERFPLIKSFAGGAEGRLYRTGDLARWLPDGNMEFLGRIDFQVKIRGVRIEPGEIENRLLMVEGVKEAAVVARFHDNQEPYLCAYIALTEETRGKNFPEHISTYLSQTLPDVMVPQYVMIMDRLPRTPVHKIDRKALPAPAAGHRYIAPRTRMEKSLVEIWSGVLGLSAEEIGIDTSFARLGGHSLKATLLAARIHKALSVRVPLAQILKHSTVRKMARVIEELTPSPYRDIGPVEKKEYYPLSSAEKRLFILQHMDKPSVVYNMPGVFRVKGKLDPESLQRVFSDLIRRHEGLRSSFSWLDGEPVRRVADDVRFRVETKDEISFFPFDLSNAPLLRVALVQPEEGDLLLLVDMHHIIADGVSHGILIRDFMELYEGGNLEPLTIQYKDYVHWLHDSFKESLWADRERYWKGRFSGDLPVLELPLDFPRPAVRGFEGGNIRFSLAPTESKALKELALTENLTLFMLSMAIFNIVLSKLSGQEDIITGTPVAGREHGSLQDIMGMFVNVLPFRTAPGGEKTIREYLAEVSQTALDAFGNQDYPFEELLDHLTLSRDPGRNPLFDVMFAFQNIEPADLRTPGLELEPLAYQRRTAKFDLTLEAFESGEELIFELEYCTALFLPQTMQRFAAYYKNTAAALPGQLDVPLSRFGILDEEERRLIVEQFNDTAADYPLEKSIHQLIAEQTQRTPWQIAVEYRSHRSDRTNRTYLSYSELDRRADLLSFALIEQGVRPGSIVALKLPRSVELITAILAVLKAGAAYLAINPLLPQDRIAYMLKDSNAFLVDGEWWMVDGKHSTPPPTPSTPHPSLAYLIYTSGSTGRPKGVLLGHRSLANFVYAMYHRFDKNFSTSDRCLNLTAVSFDVSVAEIFLPLTFGSTLVLIPEDQSFDVERLARTILYRGITFCYIPPALLKDIHRRLKDQPVGLNLNKLLAGVEPIPRHVLHGYLKLNPSMRIINAYGPTETTICSTAYHFKGGNPTGEIVPIGSPLANTRILILDKHGSPVPLGVPGEIHIAGDGLAQGYLNNPELTASRFINYKIQNTKYKQISNSKSQTQDSFPVHCSPFTVHRSYRTGDLAKWLPNGNIQFLGRVDRQVKVRGYRIEPGEIENLLTSQPSIKQAVVIDRQYENGDKYLCAYCVFQDGESLDEKKLRSHLSRDLPAYMIPSFFINLDRIPLTPNGKLHLAALPVPQSRPEVKKVSPAGPVEKMIAQTWEEVLERKDISIHDNLFESGGNSLSAIRISEKLKERLNLEIPVVDIFRYPTIQSLARALNPDDTETQTQAKGATPGSSPGSSINGIDSGDIAVIGMAGRFPGAGNISQFMENLLNGVESIGYYNDDELAAAGVEASAMKDPDYVRAQGVLEQGDCFDAGFFGYNPLEALVMDPQMRIFHEIAWETLEDAGYSPDNSGTTGLFAGASSGFGWQMKAYYSGSIEELGEFSAANLADSNYLSTHVAYKLNLKGPAHIVQTACSTSLVAIHQARLSLLAGECNMALAGGVSLQEADNRGYVYREGMILSPDGHCRPFDSRANGTTSGSGAGAVLLKPLENALQDRDHIYAVIKGSAINNDGGNRAGYTAPGIEGQAEVIRRALENAGVESETIGYIETHGTGTPLGDPVEIQGLKLAFNTNKKGYCAIGSVKSNIGHLDAAAGVAGFIKAVLSLRHRTLMPSLHFEAPNPKIDLVNSPFYVNTSTAPWQEAPSPARAGVSSFGIGGTNAHVILEESPTVEEAVVEASPRPYHLMLLSAQTPAALDRIAANIADYLKENSANPRLADLSYTLQLGRKAFPYRRTFVCNEQDLAQTLDHLTSKTNPAKPCKRDESPVIFLFPGSGSQYVNMGLNLYRNEPFFRQQMDQCFDILSRFNQDDLREILYPGHAAREPNNENLNLPQDHHQSSNQSDKTSDGAPSINETSTAQILLFILEYSLSRLLIHWGIRPAAMTGYSSSEYVAACVAGVLSLEDALELVVRRGELLKRIPHGSMLSIPLKKKELEPLIQSHPGLSISIDNGPSCVVSGPDRAVRGLVEQLKERRFMGMNVSSQHAGHSRMMEPILHEMDALMRRFKLKEPRIPYISNVTGTWITPAQATDPAYWASHLRHTVLFADGLSELFKMENALLVEVGPSRMLVTLASQQDEKPRGARFVNLLPHPNEKKSDDLYFLERLGRLWTYGVTVDWQNFNAHTTGRRLPLPTYPFERIPYNLEQRQPQAVESFERSPDQWCYIPSWRRQAIPHAASGPGEPGTWVVFADEYGLGKQLARLLESGGNNVILVNPSTPYLEDGSEAYERLFAGLPGHLPLNVLHLWSLSHPQSLDHGFHGIIQIARALSSKTGEDYSGEPVQFTVISANMQQVTGDDVLHPAAATLLGPLTVIPMEYEHIHTRGIDIDWPGTGVESLGRQLFNLLLTPPSETTENIYALRGLFTWSWTFEPVKLETPVSLNHRLRERGVYMIIGGLSGIGLEMAKYLTQTVNARLVLVSRSGGSVPPGLQDADVLVCSADVTGEEQMQEVFRLAVERFGPVNGIIHSAGLPDGELIQRRSRQSLQDILDAKVKGVGVLERLIKGRDIDFVVLNSSLNSLLPDQGQVAYVAANAFLDSYANYFGTLDTGNQSQRPFVLSIDWDRWRHVGMSVEVERLHKQYTGQDLDDGMSAGQAMDVFDRILAGEFSQVAVSTVDLNQRIEQNLSRRHGPVSGMEQVLDSKSPSENFSYNPRPELDTPYAAPVTPLEKALAELWRDFLGIDSPGIHDDFFELGGDSMKGMMLVNQYNKRLDMTLPVSVIFSAPTISTLAAHVDSLKKNRSGHGKHKQIEAVEQREYYPLSSAQKRLYFLQRMNPSATAYNISFMLPLDKQIDPNRLEEILNRLIRRHESLRTSFVELSGEPLQRIHHHAPVEIQILPFDSTADSDLRQPQPFDLSHAPLMRSVLHPLPGGRYLWRVETHHIISDGTSHNILAQEFLSLYKGENLPSLPIQYKDFCAWQNRVFADVAFKRREAYWLELFKGEIPRLDLPADNQRPAVFTFEGASLDFKIAAEQSASFKGLAAAHGTTLYMNILAVLNILFYRYTGQTDIIIGTAVAGRGHADLRHVMGMFVNTLAMRNHPEGEKSFAALLHEVKARALAAFEHQDVQFETLVDLLDIERDPSRTPLFDVSLAAQDFKQGRQLSDLFSGHETSELPTGIENDGLRHQSARFDLEFSFAETEEGIHIDIQYYRPVFEHSTIQRMISHIKSIIADINREGSVLLKDIELISPNEKEELLHFCSGPQSEVPEHHTLHSLFTEQAAKTPDRIAIMGVDQNLSLTYRVLDQLISSQAEILYNNGLRPGNIVALKMERSIEMVMAILAILKSGCAYLPIDPSYPEERIDYMLHDSNAALVLQSPLETTRRVDPKRESVNLPSSIQKFSPQSSTAVDSPHERGNIGSSSMLARSGGVCYIIYTSGTTGKPRGVMVEHHGAVDYILWAIRSYVKGERLDFPLLTSITFDLTVTSIFTPLLSGNAVAVYGEDEGFAVLNRIIRENRVGIVKCTPSHLKLIGETPLSGTIQSIKRFILGGEQLEVSLARDIHQKFGGNIEIYNEYGPTETVVGSMIHRFRPGGEKGTAVSIGTPADNTRILILDRHRNPVPIGITGEICIQGTGIARGYLNRPELTNERFMPSATKTLFEKRVSDDTTPPKLPIGLAATVTSGSQEGCVYLTGDLARWRPDGTVEFLGRGDHQVKIRGYRIELSEIEYHLRLHEHIKEAVVLIRRSTGENDILCAYVVATERYRKTGQLSDYLSRFLPSYMIPSYFIQLDSIPLTANGKINRAALPGPGRENSGETYIAPRDHVEMELVKIWAEILGLPPESIGIENGFFRLGGHSLAVIRLSSAIQKHLGVKVPVEEVFKKPRLRELAAFIHKISETGSMAFSSIPAVEEKEYYPLSPAQERLFLLQRMVPGSVAYHVPAALHLEGDVDLEKIEEVFIRLVQRHESFRTSFEMIEGRPVQRIHEWVEFRLERNVTDELFFIRPFDLSHAPLLRVGMISSNRLVLDMHHIISDGVSMDIFIREFSALYAGEESRGEESKGEEFLPLNTRYRDYCAWYKSQSTGPQLERQQKWWLEQFREEVPALELPYDFIRPAEQRFEGADLEFEVTGADADGLKGLARTEDCTLFVLLTSLFNVFLSKLSGSEDIVTGSPVSGRTHADLEGVTGMFVNTLALRNRPQGDRPFNLFLQEVKQLILSAMDNQDYPFEELVEQVVRHRDISRNPLFDVVFAMQDEPGREIRIPGLTLKPIDLNLGIAKFDLTLAASEMEDRLWFSFQYSTHLFTGETINRFVVFFKNVINALLKQPTALLSSVEIITLEERRVILEQFNNTTTEYPGEKTFIQLFEKQAEKTSDHVALVEGNRSNRTYRTYKELNRQSGALAAELLEKGVRQENIVAIKMPASVDMIVAILAVLKTGAAYLPIDPAYPEERIDYILKDSEAALLLQSPLDRGNIGSSSMLARSGGVCYIIYTSGTTGKPKGVAVSHRSLLNLCFWHNNAFNITSSDRATKYAGLGFDASVWEIFPYLLKGASLYIVPEDIKLDMPALNRYFETHDITISFLPTQVCQQFVKLDNRSLRILLTGGDRLKEYVKRNYTLVNNYGPTENTVVSTSFTVNSEEKHIPIGTPVSNTQILILDRYDNIQPVLVPGELCVTGHSLALGYLNNPELTLERFIRSTAAESPLERGGKGEPFRESLTGCVPIGATATFYRTGDLACWLPDGNIRFLGRIDQQVKIRGNRIELGEIETRLLQHPGIREATVLAHTPETGQAYLCAYLSGNSVSRADLTAYLERFLPAYMIPAYFVFMDRLPLNANGKIHRKVLPLPDALEGQEFTAPRNKIQEDLVNIWASLLKLDAAKISIDANFFEIGGHSLNASIMASRVHKDLDFHIPLTAVFKYPTVRSLEQYIQKTSPSGFQSIKAVEEKEYYGLSSGQKRLYILQQMEPLSTGYNIPGFIPLDLSQSLEEVMVIFRALIKRHESLRTSFHIVDGVPVQRIQTDASLDIRRADSDSVQDYIRPFNLEHAPLFRAVWVENRGILIDMHHIITDGTSVAILEKEFAALGKGNRLNGNSARYRDYCHWWNRIQETSSIAKQEAFWKEQFSGEIPVLDLPLDYDRPETWNFAGDMIRFELDIEKTAALTVLSRRHGVTMFMMLLAIFNVVLSRLSGKENIVIGSPVAGRNHADLEGVIGLFINTLALSNSPKGDRPFEEFLGEVKQRTLAAMEHQMYPFEELVEQVAITRDTSRNPLFDAMFTFQNIESGAPGEGVKAIESNTAKVDVHLTAADSGGKLLMAIEYATALFKADTIRRMSRYIETLVDAVLEDPNNIISQLNILPPEERYKLLHEFNDTQVEYPRHKTIHRLFQEQAERTPHHIALIADSVEGNKSNRTYRTHKTYSQLNRDAEIMADRLVRMGAGPGRIVAIMLDRTGDMLVAVLAVLKTGAAYLPIDPDYPEDRVQYMLKDSSALLLDKILPQNQRQSSPKSSSAVESPPETTRSGGVCPNRQFSPQISSAAKSPLERGDIGSSSMLARRGGVCPNLRDRVHSASPAYLIYTSGSTGRPKGVAIEHGSFVNFITGMTQHISFTKKDRVFSLTTISFDIFGLETLLTLSTGAGVILGNVTEQADAGAAGREMTRQCVTIFQATPSRLKLMLSEEAVIYALKRLKYLVVGGEAFPPHLLKQLRSIAGGKIINVYGPTETTVWSTLKDVSGEIELNIGKPIANTEIYILNKTGQLQPIGIPGELCIGGHGLARGYLNRPELTAQRFIRSTAAESPLERGDRGEPFREPLTGCVPTGAKATFYRTGDLAIWQADGTIQFLGRMDNQIKIRGFRVELGEIESQLLKQPGISEAVVLDRVNPGGEPYLCAYVVNAYVVNGGAGMDMAELRKNLTRVLPHYMIPSHLVPVEKIPLTPAGKVDRRTLSTYEAGRLETRSTYVPPKSRTEKRIAAVWHDVLGLDRLGVHDNFFELGGNSFDIVVINNHLKRELERVFPVVKMFRYPTIRTLAEFIDSMGNGGTGNPGNGQPPPEVKEKIVKKLNQGKNRLKERNRRGGARR